jgi:hypothetical protein
MMVMLLMPTPASPGKGTSRAKDENPQISGEAR